MRRLVLRITAIVVLPMALLCLVMFAYGGRLVVQLYGPQYAGNGLTVAVLSLNLLVTAAAFPLSRALFALNRARLELMVNLVALFIMITVGFWLVRAYGPIGGAFGLLGASLVTSIVRAGIFLTIPIQESMAI